MCRLARENNEKSPVVKSNDGHDSLRQKYHIGKLSGRPKIYTTGSILYRSSFVVVDPAGFISLGNIGTPAHGY